MEAFSQHPIALGTGPRTTTRSPLIRLAGWTVVAIIVATWIVLLRPEMLGGPATYLIVSGKSMEPTLHAGELVAARRQDTYRRGDVIAYRIMKNHAGAGALVIHRIVGGSSRNGYITRGDNRAYRDPWRPKPADIAGKMKLRVPHLGMLAVFSHTPFGMALIAGLAGLLVFRGGSRTVTSGDAPGSEERDAAPSSIVQEWGEALWTAPDLRVSCEPVANWTPRTIAG